MDEEDIEIDCSLFSSEDESANEKRTVDSTHKPRQAWSEREELKPTEKELKNGKTFTPTETNGYVWPDKVACDSKASASKNQEEFTICKKCLSNRNEFEKSDNTGTQRKISAEKSTARKEICICAVTNGFNELFNEVDNTGPFSCHTEVQQRTNSYNIFDLPDEIMLKIFSYFSRSELCRYVAPVCKTWLAYARDSTLWIEITEGEFQSVPSDLLVKVITSWCSLLKVLDLKGRTDIDGSDLKAIFGSCPLIENLSFAFCDQINDEMMKLLSDNCPNLKYVNFEGCKISDSSLIYLFGKPIHGLNVSHCNMISDEGLIFIAKNFKQLCSLDLDGVQWISQDSIEVLVDLHAYDLIDVTLDGADLTDNSIMILSKCCNVRLLSQHLITCSSFITVCCTCTLLPN